jgi:hypothetical protein
MGSRRQEEGRRRKRSKEKKKDWPDSSKGFGNLRGIKLSFQKCIVDVSIQN